MSRAAVGGKSVSCSAGTHPPRYLMHKYWSRKPHNVVRAWIEHYSNPGDLVLDPFCGSGVTLAEAVRAGRHAIGCDINPMAVFISEMTCRPASRQLLKDAFGTVRAAAEAHIQEQYAVPCDYCRAPATVTHTIWERRYTPAPGAGSNGQAEELARLFAGESLLHTEAMTRAAALGLRKRTTEHILRRALQAGVLFAQDEPTFLRYRCAACGARAARDLAPAERTACLALEAREDPAAFLASQPLHDTACQSVGHVHELFTRRNLRALRVLRDAIAALPDPEARRWMEFVFSSALSQASKLVFVIERRGRSFGLVDPGRKAEVGSWTVPNYWVPPRHFEINAWHCFRERYGKVLRGKEDWEQESLLAPFRGRWHVSLHDATCLQGLVGSESVDYVFTDPPYGDAIPYLGVSLMWATWLGWQERMDFAREVHLSGGGTRAASLRRYGDGLRAAAREIYRVLVPGGRATFCFNTNDAAVWRCLDEALAAAGFETEDRTFVAPARPSAKSLLAPEGSLQGDVLVTVRKPLRDG